MIFRRWWLPKDSLILADDVQAEARTRYISTVATYPIEKSDIGVYVFTEEELKESAKQLWRTALNKLAWEGGVVNITESKRQFDIYWHELTNDKVEEEF